MLKINNKSISSVYDETTSIGKIMKGTLVVYEAFKKLIASGVPPITLQKCKGVDLVDYKIYGNSVQSLLPLEYQQVEYIRNNTRKESINTGISPSINTQIEIDMQIEAYTSNAANLDFALGCRASNSNIYGRFEFHVNSNLSNTLNLGYDTTQAGRTVLTEAVQDFKRHTYVLDSNEGTSYMDDVLTCYYTNTSAYKENWEESSTPLYLFKSSYDTSSIYTTYIKIYRCKITKDDILVRDLVPCYRKSDNVIGMYDLVNDVFYINAGTGAFTKGNNAPSPDAPIEIESVGDYDKTTGKYKIPVKVNDAITNIYLNEPLRKVNDISDYIDFEKQKVFRSIKTYQITGEENWVKAQTGNLHSRYYMHFTSRITRDRTFNNCISNMLDGDSFNNLSKTTKECIAVWYQPSQSRIDICLSHDRLTTIDELKKWFKTNLVQVYYSLVTPIEEEIELPKIPTHKGTNIIEVDTNILPSNMEVKYYGKE